MAKVDEIFEQFRDVFKGFAYDTNDGRPPGGMRAILALSLAMLEVVRQVEAAADARTDAARQAAELRLEQMHRELRGLHEENERLRAELAGFKGNDRS